MNYRLSLLFVLIMLTTILGQKKIELPSLIGSHMVLQQNSNIPLWGKAEPGSEIIVKTQWGVLSHTIANNNSDWKIDLVTPSAGGPYKIIISNGEEKVELIDVLIGEVWLCSGQSNMEMPLEGWPPKDVVLNSEEEIANAEYPDIRLFSVAKITSAFQKTDCIGQWEKCSPSTVANFSAVAYFFGRKLYNELKVPIGLIHSSWGGTPAEAWTSKKWLSKIPIFDDLFTNIELGIPKIKKLESWLKQFHNISITDYNRNELWNKIELDDSLLSKSDWKDSDWGAMTLPINFENTSLGEFDGFVWFRKRIELPEEWIGKELTIELGAIDDYDRTYINGELIGSMEMKGVWKTNRVYNIPAYLNDGRQMLIAVRVNDTGGRGGIYGGKYNLKLIENESKEEIPLTGVWKFLPIAELWELIYYLFGTNFTDLNTRPKIELQIPQGMSLSKTPSFLYNGMIAPLIPYRIKGAIWYQGESNTPDPILYETLLPTMINNWREDWGYDFPFYFVQIAPYLHGSELGSQYLRDAQRKSLYLKNTGMAVSLDFGDSTTVHPSNKTVIGERLAFWALAKQYGKEIVYSGPLYKSSKTIDNRIEISFDYIGSGLEIKRNEHGNQFLISGDNKIFMPANVKVVDNKISVWSDDIKNPCAVRYAWNNIVTPTLFNKEGLPASSFRTDNW